MNIKLLDNGTKVRIKLDEEYRRYLIHAILYAVNSDLDSEYEVALAFETMRALEKTPTKLRISEFLFCFSVPTMGYLDLSTQRLIRIHLDLDKFLQSRPLQSLTQNLLQHG